MYNEELELYGDIREIRELNLFAMLKAKELIL